MDSVDCIDSQYGKGYISRGEALTRLLNILIADRSNEEALGSICALAIEINAEERKLADARLERIGVPPLQQGD